MYMFVLAFLGCALFVFFSLRKETKPSRVFTPAVAASIASLTLTIVILASVLAPLMRHGKAMIAWTSVESASEAIDIGSVPNSTAAVAWPNGAFTPALRVRAQSSGGYDLQMEGGGGFVRQGDKVLNGELVTGNSSVDINGFGVTLVPGSFRIPLIGFEIAIPFSSPHFKIDVPGAAKPVVSSALGKTRRAETMEVLVSQSLAELRRDSWGPEEGDKRKGRPELAKIAMDVERWALDVSVLPLSRDSAKVLDKRAYKATVTTAPASLEILWPNRVLRTTLARSASGRLALDFAYPWQRSAPIPTSPDSNKVVLTVAAQPRPGETVFAIPVGGEEGDTRATVEMRDGFFTGTEPACEARAEGTSSVPSSLQLSPEAALPEQPVCLATSRATVSLGGQMIGLETVEVRPSFLRLIAGVFVAWLVFVFALDTTLRNPYDSIYRQIQGIRHEDSRILAALVIVVWTFLSLRLGLSLRYSQDFSYLDRVVVEGVTWAMFALAVVPGLVLRSAMLWLPRVQQPNKQDGRRMKLLTVLLLCAGAFEVGLIEYGFWPALPAQFRRISGLESWAVFLSILAVLFLWIWARVNHEYQAPSDQLEPIHRFILSISDRYFALARQISIWQELKWSSIAIFAGNVLVLLIIYALCYTVLHSIFPGVEPMKETLAPILICLPAVCLLLNSRIAFPASPNAAQPPLLQSAVMVCLVVLLLGVVYPILLHDAGAFVVTFSLFIPTAVLLIMGGRPRRIAWLTFGLLLAGFVGAGSVVLQFKPALEAAGVLGETKLRTIEFAGHAEENILWSGVADSNSFSLDPPLHATRMRQAHQHLWEMRAIARLGRYVGVGFGEAPVRNSQVRQDTLQFDSTFSFFVLSEHGLVGGCALIGLYALPLLLVLSSARRKFDVGHGLALIIATSFFLEALSHSLMNLGALPETGRSMPLLAVKSISELLRWMIFFRVMAQAMMWRLTPARTGYSPDPAIIPAPAANERSWLTPVNRTRALWVTGTLVLIVVMGVVDVSRINDPELVELTWSGLLKTVQNNIQQHHFVLTKDARIEPQGIKTRGELLFLQEMARFNEMTMAEKTTGLPREDAERFCEAVKVIAAKPAAERLGAYDRLLQQLRALDQPGARSIRPPLFLLATYGKTSSEDEDNEEHAEPAPCGIPENSNLRLMVNPAFVSRTRFEVRSEPVFAAYLGAEPLFGSAWIDGRTVNAINKSAPIPWLLYLHNAMASGQFRPEVDESGRVTLTLDPGLQRTALQFLAKRGREQHAALLNRTDMRSPADIEPPRVALSVVNLKNGEVVALAGYPRMTSTSDWESEPAEGGSGRQWIPPARWIERSAPGSVRTRYGTDRNFDRLLMGSSTKPLWAAAALELHPSLDSELGVKGPGGGESFIFGIPIGGQTWEVDAASTGLHGPWCDLTSYLAKSDNRYHIRLGFLSVAQWSGGVPEESGPRISGPAPDPAQETINLSTQWKKYPVFPAEMGFSPGSPQQFHALGKQELARKLESLYGVETTLDSNRHNAAEPAEGRDSCESGGVSQTDVRSSFWTGDEKSDDSPHPLGRAMATISPERVNMEFDCVKSPRDFVTLLLGGGANRWSNIDFAGAFGSVVTGYPILPHIVRRSTNAVSSRGSFSVTAAKLRPGLNQAVLDPRGTVAMQLGKQQAASFRTFLAANKEYEVYAKTGTLPSGKNRPRTSRLALVLVKWKDGQKQEVESGLVFSMVIDRARVGLAAEWLGEFILQNQDRILSILHS